jgi:hypothetical protein
VTGLPEQNIRPAPPLVPVPHRLHRGPVEELPRWLLPPLALLVFFCSALAAFPFLALERLPTVLLAALPVGALWCLLPREANYFAAVAAGTWCFVMRESLTGCPLQVVGAVLGALVSAQGARMVAEPWSPAEAQVR